MRIKIIAPYPGATSTGMFGADGKEIPVGTELTVDEKTFDLPANRYEKLTDSDKGKETVLNPAPGQPINKASDSTDGENPFPGVESAPQSQMDTGTVAAGTTPAKPVYDVESKGGGYYVITKDGEPVSKSLRKADIEGFDDLSDEDKAAFADLHKA